MATSPGKMPADMRRFALSIAQKRLAAGRAGRRPDPLGELIALPNGRRPDPLGELIALPNSLPRLQRETEGKERYPPFRFSRYAHMAALQWPRAN